MLRRVVPVLARRSMPLSVAPAVERAAAPPPCWEDVVSESMGCCTADEDYGTGRSEIAEQIEFRLLLRAFDEYDLDKNRVLDRDEIKAALVGLGLSHTPKDLETIFANYDANNDGCISLEEWLCGASPSFRAAVLENFHARCT